jgi:hypothetical protein
MTRVLLALGLLLACFPGLAAASPSKPGHLPLDVALNFDHAPRPGDPVELTLDVAATEAVRGLVVELQLLSSSTRPTEWLDGLTSEARVIEAPSPWKGDLAAGAHALVRCKLALPEVGVYHMRGFVAGKGVSVGAAGSSDPLGFYDTTADLWARVGPDRTTVSQGETISWTRQWNTTCTTVHGDDLPDPPVTLSLAFEKLPTPTTDGVLVVTLDAHEELAGFALDLEMPTTGLSVPGAATPPTRKSADAIFVEPGVCTTDVRCKGVLAKGGSTTLTLAVQVKKPGWDVLRLSVSGTRPVGLAGFATHKEIILLVDDVVSAARERPVVAPAPK